jgi:bifunctional non-homologous end joining protein LigD
MALEEYQKKRSFSKTPEPTGGTPHGEKLEFVVQKHQASHLHYDFRLELKGVLKSWAVPKGPSMDPAVQRLAQAVEDHPINYKDFEGIIPKGQYGAGTVIIWDHGTYEPEVRFTTKKEQEHHLMSGYYKGKLRIILHGSKLRGKFELVKKPERGENSWILSKVNDRFKRKSDVLKKDTSVVSGLTLEQMAGDHNAARWKSNRAPADTVSRSDEKSILKQRIRSGKKRPSPGPLEPMLATLVQKPFDDADWLYELKFDGYRVQAHSMSGAARLYSRNRLDYSDKYSLICQELTKIPHEVILDGEVVLLNSRGHPDFDALQAYNGEGHLVYYAFDLLWIDGYDLTGLPLTERKEILKVALPDSEILRYSTEFNQGLELFKLVREQGLEGIVAKRRESIYKVGKRTTDWLKIPVRQLQEFVLGAWTESESGKGFRSLVFGNYQDGKLVYAGHAGHGFKDSERHEILSRLKKLETKISPFSGEVNTSTRVHWLRPELVISVEFATLTRAGFIRKPATFKGFRPDKDPQETSLYQPEEQLPIVGTEPRESDERTIPETMPDSNWPEIEKQEITSENFLPVDGTEVRVTNIERLLWGDYKVTKADLIRYYISVRQFILPYLKNRPLSLHLKPYGPVAPGLYIKDMEGREPEFAEIFRMDRKHLKKGKRNIIDYLVCQNLPSLIYVINLGAIDLNPWSSCTDAPEQPDYITIDLDPSDEDFRKAVEAARAAKELFDRLKIRSFVKTSGKTGLHLLLPCRDFSFPRARKIGERLCDEIHALVPEITTRERSVNSRKNLLYLDDSQNDLSDTIASAYSVRPFHIPSVSTPLEWKEVNPTLDPAAFRIDTIQRRLEKKGDLLREIFDRKTALKNNEALRKLM